MAFDFPASPSVNQIFDPGGGAPVYQWTGQAWASAGTTSPKAWMSISTSPPSAPKDGDFWFQTDTGLTFIRYNDGSSTQWCVIQPANDVAGLDTRYKQISDGGVFKVSSGVLASAAAQIDLVLPAGFQTFDIALNNIQPTTDVQNFCMRYSTDGGATFISTASYAWAGNSTPTNVTNLGVGSASQNVIGLSQAMSNNVSVSGAFRITMPMASGTLGQLVLVHAAVSQSTGGPMWANYVGMGAGPASINAVRLFFPTGNIAAGARYQLNGWK